MNSAKVDSSELFFSKEILTNKEQISKLNPFIMLNFFKYIHGTKVLIQQVDYSLLKAGISFGWVFENERLFKYLKDNNINY